MGIAQPSIARWGLEKQENVGLTDLEIAYALSAPFTAGVGTVSLRARKCRYLANFDPGAIRHWPLLTSFCVKYHLSRIFSY